MKTKKLAILLGLSAALVFAQGRGGAFANIDWNKPFPAHKIIGNLYFVGSEQLGSFLITTPQGHILINSDYEETVPVIRAAVEKLGFKFGDIKILLNSHAHPDHTSGDAMIKELTGAKVITMAEDVPALQNIRPGGKPHPIDRVLHDGDTVSLGGMVLTAHLTPGHTKGCTTWTLKVDDGGKSYDVVVVGSVSLNAANLGRQSGLSEYSRGFREELQSAAVTAVRRVCGVAHGVLPNDGKIREARARRSESLYRPERIQSTDRLLRESIRRPPYRIEDRAA